VAACGRSAERGEEGNVDSGSAPSLTIGAANSSLNTVAARSRPLRRSQSRLRAPDIILDDPFRGSEDGGVPWLRNLSTSTNSGFEATSKRKQGFPSETRVKRGIRVVNGKKELSEKLGRNDPCPCLSGRRFQELLPRYRVIGRF